MENSIRSNLESKQGCSEWIESLQGISELGDHCEECGEELSEGGCDATVCSVWEDCEECGALKESFAECENCDENHG